VPSMQSARRRRWPASGAAWTNGSGATAQGACVALEVPAHSVELGLFELDPLPQRIASLVSSGSTTAGWYFWILLAGTQCMVGKRFSTVRARQRPGRRESHARSRSGTPGVRSRGRSRRTRRRTRSRRATLQADCSREGDPSASLVASVTTARIDLTSDNYLSAGRWGRLSTANAVPGRARYRCALTRCSARTADRQSNPRSWTQNRPRSTHTPPAIPTHANWTSGERIAATKRRLSTLGEEKGDEATGARRPRTKRPDQDRSGTGTGTTTQAWRRAGAPRTTPVTKSCFLQVPDRLLESGRVPFRIPAGRWRREPDGWGSPMLGECWVSDRFGEQLSAKQRLLSVFHEKY
jgi:hypothetical protein